MYTAVTLILKGFIFPKELMQEHFNENYVESDKYPKASFSGTFTGNLDVSKDGQYPVMVKGMLSLHNTTKEIEVPATLEVKDGTLSGQSQFEIRPEDFRIHIPSLLKVKIPKEIPSTFKH